MSSGSITTVVTSPAQPGAALSLGEIILLRAAAGSALRSDLQRDVAPLFAAELSGTRFRQNAEAAITGLVQTSLLTETKSRLSATDSGLALLKERLDKRPEHATPFATWETARNSLICLALGLKESGPTLLKALDKPDGLASVVLQVHYRRWNGRVLSSADTRALLAMIALEQAFGEKIKAALGKGSGLAAKTGRLLAGQLLKKPREIGSDAKLVLSLAAEVTGAPAESLEAIRQALLRRLVISGTSQRAPNAFVGQSRAPANDKGVIGEPAVRLYTPLAPPDPTEFVDAVLDAARPVSKGWPGNRKAFISQIWLAIRDRRPDWGLSETSFKGMLADAHRTGRLVLATADLKDKDSLNDLEASKIAYKNTVWHLVRVED